MATALSLHAKRVRSFTASDCYSAERHSHPLLPFRFKADQHRSCPLLPFHLLHCLSLVFQSVAAIPFHLIALRYIPVRCCLAPSDPCFSRCHVVRCCLSFDRQSIPMLSVTANALLLAAGPFQVTPLRCCRVLPVRCYRLVCSVAALPYSFIAVPIRTRPIRASAACRLTAKPISAITLRSNPLLPFRSIATHFSYILHQSYAAVSL